MSWKIADVTLPRNPRRAIFKHEAELKTVPQLFRLPLILHLGPKAKVLAIDGLVVETGKTAAQLESSYLKPLSKLVIKPTAAPREIADDNQRAFWSVYEYRDPKKVFFYDASTGSWIDFTDAAKDETANDVWLPPTDVTQGDILYIGEDQKFAVAMIRVTRAGVYSGMSLVWEYWNGASWVTLTVTDPSNGFQSEADHDILFTPPADWAKTTVHTDTVARYWIRCRSVQTNSPSVSTPPLAGRIKVGKTEYVDDATVVKKGENSLKISAASHRVWIEKSFDPALDLEALDFVSFWFKGANSGETFILWFDDGTGANRYEYSFIDNSTDWKRIVVRLDEFTKIGTISWKSISRIVFYSAAAIITITIYFDRLVVGLGVLVEAPDSRYDGIYVPKKFDYQERGGQVAAFDYSLELWCVDDFY